MQSEPNGAPKVYSVTTQNMHGHSDGGLGRGKNSLKYIVNLTLIEILQMVAAVGFN